MFNRFIKPEIRYARRMARIKRWDAPINGWWAYLKAYLNMLFVDHGVFRVIYLNKHQVNKKFWRSAQPTPGQVATIAKSGVRTIVNLRGGREYGSWPLERDACAAHGITLKEFVVRSREAPSKETILSARDFFDELEYPILVHCKSGADRAGLMSALYLILHEGMTVSEAKRQLWIWYGHFRFAKTGILDAFFELYEREGVASGKDFITWVREDYDPEKLKAQFRPHLWATLLVDEVMQRE